MSKKQYFFRRVRVTVLDGVGCGAEHARDALYPRDTETNSLVHASEVHILNAPALQSLGLERIPGLEKLRVKHPIKKVIGAYGALRPTFIGNGSPEGHQALMGHIITQPYQIFNETGFPAEVIKLVTDTIKPLVHRDVRIVRYPNTDDINGVKFINHPGIGDAHLASKDEPGPLLIPMYSSTDSVLQLALHQDVVPQSRIEEIGKAVRVALNRQGWRVARVILRPFTGGPKAGMFTRVSKDRKDLGVNPDQLTLINFFASAHIPVYGIGKAASMLNESGFEHDHISKLGSDEERMQAIVASIKDQSDKGPSFYFDNLVGTDELFGHTRKPKEYIEHIEMIDSYVGKGMGAMQDDDLWIIASDHGNDPTQRKHTNHTNERVPLLVYHPKMRGPINLGLRASYADVAKTIAENFGISEKIKNGTSFLHELAS